MSSQLKIVKTRLHTQMSQEFLNLLIKIRHGIALRKPKEQQFTHGEIQGKGHLK